MECGGLPYGKRFALELKGAVFQKHTRSVILYGSEA